MAKRIHIWPQRFLLALCSLTVLSACSDVIDLNTAPGPSQLLVFGRLTSGLEGNTIELAFTTETGQAQVPVTGATITLVAESGAREQYLPTTPGTYQLFNSDIVGEIGRSYHVEIALADGRQYESVPATMPGAVAMDFLDFEAKTSRIRLDNGGEVSRNVVELYMDTEILSPDKAFFIRWNLVETYLYPERPQMVNSPDFPPPWCYITHDLEEQAVFLYDGSGANANRLGRRLMTTRVADEAFVSEYYFQVVRSSITAGAYRFWNSLDKVTNPGGTIFDTPPGPVVSNVFNINNPNEEVLGYFEVSHVDTTRYLLSGEDLPFDIRTPCPIVGQVAPECLDCLLLDNAVKVKPYFVD